MAPDVSLLAPNAISMLHRMPNVALLLTALALLAACGSDQPPAPAAGNVADIGAPDSSAAPVVFRVPDSSLIPEGPEGVSIRRGRALLMHTRDSLPDHVGNNLRCVSCHLDAGTRQFAAPWVGVYSRFPQYRSRNAKINVIEDRINDCFQRSLNGVALEPGSPELADMIAYMAFLSRGVPPPGDVPGQGFKSLEVREPDRDRGRLVFSRKCAICHGKNGEGQANPDPDPDPLYYPPLWGPRSYTIGAGMARLRTAAAFIHANMPFDRPGSISERDAWDVAAYLVSRPRPDYVGKENDWPGGNPPPDVAYRTAAAPDRGARTQLLPARQRP
jgi:thiosulfate dehydrogenase